MIGVLFELIGIMDVGADELVLYGCIRRIEAAESG